MISEPWWLLCSVSLTSFSTKDLENQKKPLQICASLNCRECWLIAATVLFPNQCVLFREVWRLPHGLIRLNVKVVGSTWLTAPLPPLYLPSDCTQIIERRQNASSTFHRHNSPMKKKKRQTGYLKVDWQWNDQILEHTLGIIAEIQSRKCRNSCTDVCFDAFRVDY